MRQMEASSSVNPPVHPSPSDLRHDVICSWRENNDMFYEYMYENHLDWPCTSCQWGPVVHSNYEFTRQKVYFSCRTGSVYNETDGTWKAMPNYIIVATVDIPNDNHYFINELRSLFNYEEAKKHPNLKVKHVIMHPGYVNVIRSSPSNRKILATKNDHNQVFVWTPEKHKSLPTNYPQNPYTTLLTSPGGQSNFSLVFTPTLPRIMSASNNRLELFDLDTAISRRYLGSVLSSNAIGPTLVMEISQPTNGLKEKIEDIAFKDKNNELCVTGGLSRRLGFWDLRLGGNTAFVDEVHKSDINCVSWKGPYIISGGSDKCVLITDERKLKTPLYSFEMNRDILSIHWNSESNHFAVGSYNLNIYSFEDIENTGKFEPIFSHAGMRGPINDFDWNSDNPWNIISTCLELEPDTPATGGSLHIFRPLDLLHLPRYKAVSRLYQALQNAPNHKNLLNMFK